MTRKKIVSVLLAAACILALGVGAAALEVDCDSKYCFSADDFSKNDLEGVCITGLPENTAGTVMLGQRVIRCGDILTAQQLNELTFHPLRTENDTDVTVSYLPIYENRVEKATTMTISIRGKEDRAPVAEDSAMETYKNLPNTGTLKAHDPEGEDLTFTITRSPKRGDVTVNEDGTFTYTPKKNKVGTDSFTYTATDPAGNVSRQATVTIQILKPCDKQTYADTIGKDCRFSAEWMRSTGIFTGEMVSGQLCFRPEQIVTRGEFVAMLVNVLGIEIDEEAGYTGFTDDCPTWLKPYLAAALRSGLTAGWEGGSVFGSDKPITGQEAALLLQNALDLPMNTASMEGENPDLIAVMAENGIILTAEASMNRSQAANALYRVSKLSATAPGLSVIAKQ